MKVETHSVASGRPQSLSVTVTFENAGLQMRETPFGTVVELAGCKRAGAPGGPALPARVIHVALPPYTRPGPVTVRSLRTRRVTCRRTLVAPYQPPRPTSPAPRAQPPDSGSVPGRPPGHALPRTLVRGQQFQPPQAELYEAEIGAPRPLAQLVGVQHIGLTPVAAVQINPVRYRRDGSLEFISALEITVAVENAFDLTPPADGAGLPALVRDRQAYLNDALLRAGSIRSKAQADRQAGLLGSLVINPGDLSTIPLPNSPPVPTGPVVYLIITDDYLWNERPISRGNKVGDLVAAFQRLADWREQNCTWSRVVTITDIVSDVYGKFGEGALDLQEVIRNFLKWAYSAWGISYVLLGGDVGIVPVRWVGDGWPDRKICWVTPGDNLTPGSGQSYWTGSYLKMNLKDVDNDWWGWSGWRHRYLVWPANGAIIPQYIPDSPDPGSPRWYFTTDDSYATPSADPTDYVRVEGPDLASSPLQWLYDWNMIPTDFYYASLFGGSYGPLGVGHDWDVLANGGRGLYGQRPAGGDDGISYWADLSVGRAPVDTTDNANTFVDKVIAYEQFRMPDGTPINADWPCRALYIAFDWVYTWVERCTDNPPQAENLYYHADGSGTSLLRVDPAAVAGGCFEVRAQLAGQAQRLIPYATSGNFGWHFVMSDTDLTPSVLTFVMCGEQVTTEFPQPTEWILVSSNEEAELRPLGYVLDEWGPDDSMTDTETLRKQMEADFPNIATVGRLYLDDMDLSPEGAGAGPLAHITQDGVKEALNARPHLVFLSGHGNTDGCCWVDGAMVPQLYNSLPGFICYADSCLTGAFDVDSVGDRLVCRPEGGALAYIGYTRFGFCGTGDDFERRIYHSLGSPFTIVYLRLGPAIDTRCLLVSGRPSDDYKWTVLAINLLGDPLIHVWPGEAWPVDGDVSVGDGQVQYHSSGVGEGTSILAKIESGEAVYTVQTESNPDHEGGLICALPPDAAGDVEVTVRVPGRVPLIVTRHLARPGWVSGRVTGVAYGGERARETRRHAAPGEGPRPDGRRGLVDLRGRARL